jgi:hypothetical protein
MVKTEKKLRDRRADYEQRLKTAVRKAHDRLFTILRPEEDQAEQPRNPRSVPPHGR